MKNTTSRYFVFLLIIFIVLPIQVQAKNPLISLNVENAMLKQVFEPIEKQSGFLFFYNETEININEKVSINVKDKRLTSVLDELFKDKAIGYKIKDKHIVLYKRKNNSSSKDEKPLHITGQVIDNQGFPVIGAVVSVKWTDDGTATDANGNFEINVPYANATLEFSYLGYKKQDVNLEGKTSLIVSMLEETTALTEVVVVGYGTQKKLSVTGAVTSASLNRIQQIATPSLSNTLVGSMSGIITRQVSGEPGNDASQIFIRGMGTWVNRNPLIMVDGIERDLNMLNTQEIESITMLKDASATAVYGVRGANGVILITTKRGVEGKPKVEFRTENAVLSALRLPNYTNAYEYATLINEALIYSGKKKRYSNSELNKFISASDPLFYPDVNWVDEILQKNAYQSINNLSVSGGTETVKYYVNVGYTNQTGLYKEDPKNEYKTNADAMRYNFRSNIDIKVAHNFDLNLGIGGIIQHNYYPGVSADRIFYGMKIIPPLQYPPMNPDGSVAGGQAYLADNPWGLATQSGYSRQDKNTIQGTFSGKWDLSELITRGLSVKGTFSYDHFTYINNVRYKEYETKRYMGLDGSGEEQYITFREGKPMDYWVGKDIYRSVYTELAANYDRSFDVHKISGLFLANRREYVNLGTDNYRQNLPYHRQGLAGRLTYGFDDRYLLEFNFGYNGSENFPKGKQYGFFPSLSAGWILTNEKFYPSFAGVSYLKLRASYGKVGNDEIGGVRFLYESLYGNSTYGAWFGASQQTYSGLGETQIGNPNITWEVADKLDIGLDMNFFDDKLQFQLDGFYELRKGILLKRQGTTPEFSGIEAAVIPYANLGRVKNRGIDGMIDYNNKTGDFFYSVKGTFTFARNKVLYNDEAKPKYPYQSGIGKKIDQPFGLVAIGFFKDQNDIDNSPRQTFMSVVKPGDIKYEDINHDDVIDNYDAIAIGYPRTPEIVAGLGGTLGYKNWELTVFFQGATNTGIFIEGESIYAFQRGLGTYNILREYYDNRWTPTHTDAKYPGVSEMENPNNNQRSTLYLRDASYLRLKSAEIAWRVPDSVLQKFKIANARLFLNGMNLFTLDKLKIIDPESNYGTGGYPLQRSINMGLQIGF
ncbi:MAG: TonB-dependent receptor [Candidatus Symbiothrix sp.]|jgi:TonB-linked SusC/RagA family outer membrane protein|nr:TonB-dependent receptor [Candidatus Symbiothrix sp.]